MTQFTRVRLVAILLLAMSPPSYASAIMYGYDALSRVVRVTYGDETTISYTYDAAGNRLSEVVDAAVPSVAIEVPTNAGVYTTSAVMLDVSGTAADDVAVAGIMWSNDRGGSGTAVGTTSWAVLGIPLQLGVNVLTVTAADTVGKMSVVTLTVTLAAATPTETFTLTSTPTRTNTPTRTPTATHTRTVTPIFTFTPTNTASPTPTFTGTRTHTPTRSPTASPTQTVIVTPTPTGTLTPSVTLTPSPTATGSPSPSASPTLTPTPPACVGDCNNDGAVTVDEIVTGLNIGLGSVPMGNCLAMDTNADGEVAVDELVTAINVALIGCQSDVPPMN